MTDSEQLLKEVAACYDTLVSWAELYETASFEKKKMIVNCLIRRVDVFRGYKLHIDFNFDYQQFLEGLDSIEALAFLQVLLSGGDEGDRTPYLLNAIQALSQVSYTPMTIHFFAGVRFCAARTPK